MSVSFGIVVGVIAWFVVRYLLAGLYTVDQNERAVKTVLGRAQRLGDESTLDDPIAEGLRPDERDRYRYPQLRVIPPGGPYFKWPWERVHKVSIATRTVNMAFDPEVPDANSGGTMLEAVTKDQLNTGLTERLTLWMCEQLEKIRELEVCSDASPATALQSQWSGPQPRWSLSPLSLLQKHQAGIRARAGARTAADAGRKLLECPRYEVVFTDEPLIRGALPRLQQF